jgi:uncharacterized membrane protein YhaH (DUF805 family)
MSFTEAVRTVYRNYAKFDGRASRPEYWWFVLFYLIVVIGVYTVGALFGVGTYSYTYSYYTMSPVFTLALLAVAIFGLATFIPGLAVAVRRLHDTDKSGWWMLLIFLPYIGGFVLLILLALPGTPGINQFGPPPGVAGDIRRVNYRGPTPQETWAQYTQDAQRAGANGYQPVSQQWKRDGMGDYLEVTYTSAQMGWQQPGWQAPTWQQTPPGGPTPLPGPASASTQGGQHPFDGPPPDRPTGV